MTELGMHRQVKRGSDDEEQVQQIRTSLYTLLFKHIINAKYSIHYAIE